MADTRLFGVRLRVSGAANRESFVELSLSLSYGCHAGTMGEENDNESPCYLDQRPTPVQRAAVEAPPRQILPTVPPAAAYELVQPVTGLDDAPPSYTQVLKEQFAEYPRRPVKLDVKFRRCENCDTNKFYIGVSHCNHLLCTRCVSYAGEMSRFTRQTICPLCKSVLIILPEWALKQPK